MSVISFFFQERYCIKQTILVIDAWLKIRSAYMGYHHKLLFPITVCLNSEQCPLCTIMIIARNLLVFFNGNVRIVVQIFCLIKPPCLFPHSDGSWFWSRHWDGEVLQHQMSGFRTEAKCGGAGCNCQSIENAWRWPECKVTSITFCLLPLYDAALKYHNVMQKNWIIRGMDVFNNLN